MLSLYTGCEMTSASAINQRYSWVLMISGDHSRDFHRRVLLRDCGGCM